MDSMTGVNHQRIKTNGIWLHVAEKGTGPLVLLLHGFPELWYAWRHQIEYLAENGYHVVAPDLRGYGDSDAPLNPNSYTIFHIVGYLIGLLNKLVSLWIYRYQRTRLRGGNDSPKFCSLQQWPNLRACFEVTCVDDPKWCLPGTTKVTATNLCPPSKNPSANWCIPPSKHFDLSQPMFLKIAKFAAARIVPIHFQRVPCFKRGGIKFYLSGRPNFLLVLVYNVGGAGEVVDVKVQGLSTGWIQMTCNWGQMEVVVERGPFL